MGTLSKKGKEGLLRKWTKERLMSALDRGQRQGKISPQAAQNVRTAMENAFNGGTEEERIHCIAMLMDCALLN